MSVGKSILKYGLYTIGGIVALLVLSIGGCIIYYANPDTFIQRYEITMEVEVDGVLKTASSVVEIKRKKAGFGDSRALGSSTRWDRGTMPVLDLGDYGDIVMVMAWVGFTSLVDGKTNRDGFAVASLPGRVYVEQAYFKGRRNDFYNMDRDEFYYKLKGAKKVKKDIHPFSVNIVWRPPHASSMLEFKAMNFRLLSQEAGEGVRPVRVTIEGTDKPVLMHIPDKFTWVKEWRDEYAEAVNSGAYSAAKRANPMILPGTSLVEKEQF